MTTLQLLHIAILFAIVAARAAIDPCFVAELDGSFPKYPAWAFPIDGTDRTGKEAVLQRFNDWLVANTSVYLHPHVRLQYFEDGRRFGVVATKDFHALEILSRTADEDMIVGTVVTSLYNPDDRRPYDFDPNEYPLTPPTLTYLDESVLGQAATSLALRTIYELLIGDASRWAPYIAIFPSIADFEAYMPAYWARSDLNRAARAEWYDRGSEVQRQLLRSLELEQARFLSHMRGMCGEFGYNASPLMRRLLCDESLHVWALMIRVTRSWSSGGGKEELKPLTDMYNHGDGGNSVFHHTFEGLAGAIVASPGETATSAGPFAGEELTQTYKRHQTYAQFFITDGFVSDAGSVMIPPRSVSEQEASLSAAVLSRMRDLGCWTVLSEFEYHPRRLRDAPICALSLQTYTCYRLLVSSPSDNLLEFYMAQHSDRVATLTDTEIWLTSSSLSAAARTYSVTTGWYDIRSLWEEDGSDVAVWRAMAGDLGSFVESLPTTYEADRVLAATGKQCSDVFCLVLQVSVLLTVVCVYVWIFVYACRIICGSS
jgi:hypothetical protein